MGEKGGCPSGSERIYSDYLRLMHELDLGSLSNYEDAYDGNILTDERANALSNFKGTCLRINGFKGLSDKAAESLSKLTSRLELVNGEGISQKAYTLLEEKGATLD